MLSRLLLLLPVFLLASCVYFPVREVHREGPPGKPAHAHCQSHKHACEKYDKELHKKHPKQDKIDRYRQECAEYNNRCL